MDLASKINPNMRTGRAMTVNEYAEFSVRTQLGRTRSRRYRELDQMIDRLTYAEQLRLEFHPELGAAWKAIWSTLAR